MIGRVFDRTTGLVREFAEIHFKSMRRGAEHVDIRAGTENAGLQARYFHYFYFRMLEAQTLNSVRSLAEKRRAYRALRDWVDHPQRLWDGMLIVSWFWMAGSIAWMSV